MLILSISSVIGGVLPNSYNLIYGIIKSYGYAAILLLMTLESSTLPIPSEVVLPLAGLFAAKGALNILIVILVSMLGSAIGFSVDYYIGYYLEKDVVYKHLSYFHIKRRDLDDFSDWFDHNGAAAVFITRLIPVLRTVISFPAGFAKMPKRKFFLYSLSGALIWTVVLTLFGFYFLSAHSAVFVMESIGAFALILYVIYALARKHMSRK
jgi:membrane protein DedA with SNARE-associated domain